MYLEIITWAIILVMALATEAMTAGALVSIWFVPGAIVGMLLALLEVPFWIQVAVWLAIAIVCITVTHTIFKDKINARTSKNKTNLEAIIGENGIVTEGVDNVCGRGAVKVKGMEWSARSVSEEETFSVGDVVTVVAIEGVKLICKKRT